VQPLRHHVADVPGHGMEADHRTGGHGVGQAGHAQLHRPDATAHLLFGAVGDVHQARDHPGTAHRGGDPARQVGLEQRGVHDVGSTDGDEPRRPAGPPRPAAAPGQAVQRNTDADQLVLQPRALVERRHLQADPTGGEVRCHGDKGALGAARNQAVDQVEHVQSVAPGVVVGGLTGRRAALGHLDGRGKLAST
jgi:hypothetical protein